MALLTVALLTMATPTPNPHLQEVGDEQRVVDEDVRHAAQPRACVQNNVALRRLLSARQVMPQAVPGYGPPRLTSRLVCAGRPHRLCFPQSRAPASPIVSFAIEVIETASRSREHLQVDGEASA